IGPAEAGLHLLPHLIDYDDRLASTRLAENGIHDPALASYAVRPQPYPGLVLGYAPLKEPQIRQGVETMARVLIDS
ncbi:MAG: PLP-dependent aminotransferase family protein, partial [Anaerolineae bacterium]|nr:PLP-dependent aminotransferase family protein [Anaerolineae bacterium]